MIIQILSFITAVNVSFGQEIYKSTSFATEFFSSAPIEDIAAHSDEGISLWNIETGEISFKINIRSFEFEKRKMQEHFNENFMESSKYPSATFKGKVQHQHDLSKEGNHKVTLKGILEIHGEKQIRETEAEIEVQEDKIELTTQFRVRVADHDIKIPKILWRNIAEEVDVKVKVNYSNLER